MRCILFGLCIYIFSVVVSSKECRRRYQITFPQNDNAAAYAKLYGTINRPLSEYTLCHWSKTKVNGNETLFSYSTDTPSKDYLAVDFWNRNGTEVIIYRGLNGSNTGLIDTRADGWKWIHLCTIWTVQSFWQLFINGMKTKSGRYLGSYSPLPPGGMVVLGKDVWNPEKELSNDRPFIGHISELHLWNYMLTTKDVLDLYQCSFSKGGNVIDWNEEAWSLYNGARISPVDLSCGVE